MTTALHHRLTPTQQEIRGRHLAFKARIAARARSDTGISCQRERGRIPANDPPPPPPTVEQVDEWAERQKAIPLPPKEPWFFIVSIEEEIEAPKQISVRRIQRAVCKDYGIELLDMLSARRFNRLSLPRQVAGYIAKKHTLLTLPALGRMFGGRDHSTQLHAVRKITKLLATDPDLRATVERIERSLGLGGDLG